MRVVFKALNFKGFLAKGSRKNAFSLIEVLAVITIIGILAALAYSSLMDLILTNRAKESAQVMRSFAESALKEGKRQNKEVTIKLSGGSMIATVKTENNADSTIGKEFLSGFDDRGGPPSPPPSDGLYFNQEIKAEPRIGLSSITDAGYFAACGPKGYCGAAVKSSTVNYFVGYIRKGTKASWEAL